MIMSYNINQYNNIYTIGNSQKSQFEDKLHLPIFQFDNKHEEPECTVINIIGYLEQDINEDFLSSTGHILPLTVQDLNQHRNNKHAKHPDTVVISNFIENLISTNQTSKISNAILSSIKSIGGLFSEPIIHEDKKIPGNDFPIDYQDYQDYCDAV